jgi:hypothetical protein
VVNDLKELMRENVAAPPPDPTDLPSLVLAGRRRVRHRRATAGGVAAVVAGVATAAVLGGLPGSGQVDAADHPPTPDAPTITLADARQAVEGRDYALLASHTNRDLDADNGQYFDGVTDDGLVLFRDGPRMDQFRPRFALLDPATGAKDWLPDLHVGQSQTWPVQLGTDRLVLLAAGDDTGERTHVIAHVFDRTTRQWTTLRWPDLPALAFPSGEVGPDGRLYVSVPATQGQPPEGGWPTGPDGEADDADYEGDTFHLWSVSLTDGSDVRDEGLTVGDLAFTDSAMVWTESTNGQAIVHVRDLASGEEHSFDTHAGEKCNLLSFGATDDRIVMGQYCGTYAGGVRDDRVQILTTDGEQVVTLQDSGIDGALAGSGGAGDVVTVSAFGGPGSGTYVYDLDTDRFLRISDAVSNVGVGGPTPDGRFLWHTPVNQRHGATQWLGRLLP